MDKTCSIDGCGKGGKIVRGWCDTHYKRWQHHGDPMGGGRLYSTPEDAFAARTEWRNGCLVWTGSLNTHGYGHLSVDGKTTLAHRYAWRMEHGGAEVPPVLDHRCWNRACCNVAHLRPATYAENARYRSGVRRAAGHALPRGVFRSGGRYVARVTHDGTAHYLGTFDTIEEASTAAANKRAILFGAFAGGA